MNDLRPHTITLSVYDKLCTKFGVTWQTESKGTPILEYTSEADTEFLNALRVKAVTDESTGTTKNSAVISGVKPGEKCRWRVGDESGVYSSAALFTAPRLDSEKLKFLVLTDSQDGENRGLWLKAATDDIAKRYADAELLVHTGDIVEQGGNREMWQQMFGYNEEFFRSIPMAPVAGNHDYWPCYQHGYNGIIDKHFTIDAPPQDIRHGTYYSFDAGPAHFTVLSSGDCMENGLKGLLAGQEEWAKNDIKSTDKKWKIVLIHNPLYSPGKYGCRDPLNSIALDLRRQLNEFFVENGVDLVICGHDHVYSKSYPIAADGLPITDYEYEEGLIEGIPAKIAVSPKGPIHFEAGCAGDQNRGVIEDITEEFAACFEDTSDMTPLAVAYAAVDIEGDMLTVTYREHLSDTGECVKERAFGIKK